MRRENMTYPREFYFNEIQDQLEYTATPSGIFDLQRLLNGQEFWVTAASQRQLKPKKLILSDWSALQWSAEKTTQIQITCAQLIDAGFDIYLWYNSQVRPLLKHQLVYLHQFMIRQDMDILAHADTISAIASQKHRIPREQIQILDDYWIRQILGQTEDTHERSFMISQLPSYARYDQTWLNGLVSILKNSTPALQHINCDVFSSDIISTSRALGKPLHGLDLTYKYQIVRLPYYTLCTLSIAKQVIVDGVLLTLTQFALINELQILSHNDVVDRHIYKIHIETYSKE